MGGRVVKVVRAGGLCGVALGVWQLQQNLAVIGVPLYAAGIGVAVLAAAALSDGQITGDNDRAWFNLILGLAVLGGAIFCRVVYLWTVPSGYDYEPLGFLFFARRLVDDGFPYIPYAWYAHTLYSYWIAVVLLFSSSDIGGYRIALAALSVTTTVVMYVTAARLWGRRVAWIAVGLLSASWWHLWSSRNGYHQQLMPLLQTVYLCGVVMGFTTAPWTGFGLAALAVVLGLHGYWGLYLLLPLSICIAIYIVVLHADIWRRHWVPLAAATLVAVIGLIPLAQFLYIHRDVFSYIGAAIGEPSADSTTLAEKRWENLRYIAWALSGNAKAQVAYGSVLDPLAAAAAVVGLGAALRRSRRSIADAVLCLLLIVNLVGLVFTVANYFYITATMASVYLLAAIGVAAILSAGDALVGGSRLLLTLIAVSLLGLQTVRNYEAFFYHHVFTDLRSPEVPVGRAFLILDWLPDLLRQDHAVFLPEDEPGRDFDSQIFELAQRIPAYRFVHRTLRFNATRILFPKTLVGERPLDLLLPNRPFVAARLLPLLRDLYPQLRVIDIEPPEPYRSVRSEAVAFQISIPSSAVSARQGLRVTAGDQKNRRGFVVAPRDAWYRFHAFEDSGAVISVHSQTPNDEAIYLEAGLHPVHVSGWAAEQSCPIEWRIEGERWHNLEPALVNCGDVDPTRLEPYLAHRGRIANFYYHQIGEHDLSQPVRDATIAADGSIALLEDERLLRTDPRGTPVAIVGLAGVRDGTVSWSAHGLRVVDAAGGSYEIDHDTVVTRGASPCEPVAVVNAGEDGAILCRDAVLLESRRPEQPMGLRGPRGQPLLGAAQLARHGQSFFVVDAQASELLHYDAGGTLLDVNVLPYLWPDSEMSVDPDGNLYIKHRRLGLRAYGPDGTLLLHPLTKLPSVLLGDHMPPDLGMIRHLKFAGTHAIAVSTTGTYRLFERVAVPQ